MGFKPAKISRQGRSTINIRFYANKYGTHRVTIHSIIITRCSFSINNEIDIFFNEETRQMKISPGNTLFLSGPKAFKMSEAAKSKRHGSFSIKFPFGGIPENTKNFTIEENGDLIVNFK